MKLLFSDVPEQALSIGIDGRVFEGNLTGIGKYSYAFCEELNKILPNATFYVFLRKEVDNIFFGDNWISIVDKSIWAKKLKPALWVKFRLGFLLDQYNLTHFIGMATLLPKVSAKTISISIVYDLVFRLYPETMGFLHSLSHKLFFDHDLEQSNKLISISHGTAAKVEYYYSRKVDCIFQPVISNIFYKRYVHECGIVLKKYKIDFSYILSVSTIEPRKNIIALLNAFKELKNENKLSGVKLLLVGKKGWKEQKILDLIHDLGEQVVFLGYVPEADLPFLYSSAHLFVFPSIYEGFGMPVKEAVLCQTPVLASDIAEIREAGGNGAIYVSPTVENLKSKIVQIFQNNGMH